MRSYSVTKVSHRKSEDFIFDDWVDQSDNMYKLFFMESLKMIRLRVKSNIEMSPLARSNYEKQKAKFIREN